KPVVSLWRSGFIRYATGIAAAFVIVMLGAKLLGVQMNYSGNELSISFGAPAGKQSGLSPTEVENMINNALSKNNQFVQASLDESQNKLSNALKENSDITSQKLDKLSKNSSVTSQEQIRQFMQTLQGENSQAMQEYIRLSTSDQKQ